MRPDLHRLLIVPLLYSSMAAADDIAAAAAAPIPPAGASACAVADAALRARLRGALEGDLDWRGTTLECAGMPRPDGAGVRVRFRGPLPDGRALAVVFAAPALAPGADRDDLPVNVTLIVEDTGMIFGTQGADRCRLDSVRQQPQPHAAGDARRYRIDGRGYCTAPATAIAGGGGVLVNRFDFVGQVDVSPDDDTAPATAAAP